jgi:hypothetical protein
MRLVNNRRKVKLLAKLYNSSQIRKIPVHTEDRVGHNKPTFPLVSMRSNQFFKFNKIAMRVHDNPRFAEPAAVDQTGVIKPIAKDDIRLSS